MKRHGQSRENLEGSDARQKRSFEEFHFFPVAAARSLQSCLTLCDPIDGSPPGSPSLGFSRQEHWSGLPFPSLMCESEVGQSCLTRSDPMDRSLPGSSVHGIFQARGLEWGAIVFSIFSLGAIKILENSRWGDMS